MDDLERLADLAAGELQHRAGDLGGAGVAAARATVTRRRRVRVVAMISTAAVVIGVVVVAESGSPARHSLVSVTSPSSPTTTMQLVVSTTATGTTVVTTTEPGTTPETTVTASTDAPTTTSSGPVIEAALRGDGLGTVRFGASVSDVMALFDGVGAPTYDMTRHHTEPWLVNGVRRGFVDGNGAEFVHPWSREVCWGEQGAFGMCVVFGGESPDALTFAGWRVHEPDEFHVVDTVGMGIGSRWSDFLTHIINVPKGGCYQVGSGTTTDGILLELLAQKGTFEIISADGTQPTATRPKPADTVVFGMRAGDTIIDTHSDC